MTATILQKRIDNLGRLCKGATDKERKIYTRAIVDANKELKQMANSRFKE